MCGSLGCLMCGHCWFVIFVFFCLFYVLLSCCFYGASMCLGLWYIYLVLSLQILFFCSSGRILGVCWGAVGWWFGLWLFLYIIIFLINILFVCFCGKPWCTYQVLLSLIFVACSVLWHLAHMGFCLPTPVRFYLPIAVAEGGFRGEIQRWEPNLT